jgi:hypothetical protein
MANKSLYSKEGIYCYIKKIAFDLISLQDASGRIKETGRIYLLTAIDE